MNWDAIGAIAELLGALAVFLTLVYLSIQIRQSNRSTQSVAELEASRQLTEAARRIGRDPQMRQIWDQVADGRELGEDDHSAFLWLLSEVFFMCEGVFLQYKKGFLSEELWEQFERLIVGYIQHPSGRAWWDQGNQPFTPTFKEHVEHLLQRQPAWRVANVAKTTPRNPA